MNTYGRNLVLACALVLGGTCLQGGESQKGPWLELKHLSTTQLPGYEQTVTKDGTTYYCAPTAVLDPIGFADVLPAADGKGVTIALTVAARDRLHDFTVTHVREEIGIFVDGKLVQGPIVIAQPLSPWTLPLNDGLTADVCDRLIQAWSAPVDLWGKHRLYVQGLGTVEVEPRGGSVGDFCFLYKGSIYGLPRAFAARPELKPKEKQVHEIVVNKDGIMAGDVRFATVQEAIEYIKNHAGPDNLLLVNMYKPAVDKFAKEEMHELWPLIEYLQSHPPYVGLRQQMPEGWTWPTLKTGSTTKQTAPEVHQP